MNKGPNEPAVGEYLLPNTWEKARERLTALQDSVNPLSKQWLTCVEPGHHCLEVGPGLGSMTQYIAGRCGPEGRVVAVDIDDQFLPEVAAIAPTIETVHADIREYDPGENRYDLIYLRLVMIHLVGTDHQTLIEKLVLALKPGGTMLIDDYVGVDNRHRFLDLAQFDERLPNYLVDAQKAIQHRVDFSLGYRLPGLLQQVGLNGITSSIVSDRVRGGSHYGRYMKLSFEQIEAHLQDIPDHDVLFPKLQALWDDEHCHWFDYFRIFVQGRRPGNRR